VSTSSPSVATLPDTCGHMFATLIETGKVPTEKLFDQSVIAGRDPSSHAR